MLKPAIDPHSEFIYPTTLKRDYLDFFILGREREKHKIIIMTKSAQAINFTYTYNFGWLFKTRSMMNSCGKKCLTARKYKFFSGF